MSENAPGHKLYDAAVGFLVADKSHSNAWAQVAEFTANYPLSDDGLHDLQREFRTVERQIKKDFELGRLPAAWRSAKSTALKALKAGIPLLNVSNGTAVPKSDVSKLLSATKKGVSVTPRAQIGRHLSNIGVLFMSMSDVDKASTIDDIEKFTLGLAMVLKAPARAAAMAASS